MIFGGSARETKKTVTQYNEITCNGDCTDEYCQYDMKRDTKDCHFCPNGTHSCITVQFCANAVQSGRKHFR